MLHFKRYSAETRITDTGAQPDSASLEHEWYLNTSLDNMNVQLLPSDAFNQQIWAINIALMDKIKDMLSSNPLLFQAVNQMKRSSPSLTDLGPRIEPSIIDDSTSSTASLYWR